jgi:hypothetical protein
MVFYGLHVATLVHAFGRDRPFAEGARPASFRQGTERDRWVAGDQPQHRTQVAVGKRIAGAQQVAIIGKHLLRARHVRSSALNDHGISFQIDGDVKTVFDEVQVLVTGTKEGFDMGGDLEILLHLRLKTNLLLRWRPLPNQHTARAQL